MQDGRVLPLTRIRIVGPSMAPTLRNGDWWLVRRTARVRPGDVALIVHPHRPGLLLVKRIERAEDGGWWAIGLHTPAPTVFAGVPMSQADTGHAQWTRLETLGLAAQRLDPLRDVDEPDDVGAVAALAPDTRFAAEDDGGRGIGAVLAGHDGRRGLCESAMPWLASYV